MGNGLLGAQSAAIPQAVLLDFELLDGTGQHQLVFDPSRPAQVAQLTLRLINKTSHPLVLKAPAGDGAEISLYFRPGVLVDGQSPQIEGWTLQSSPTSDAPDIPYTFSQTADLTLARGAQKDLALSGIALNPAQISHRSNIVLSYSTDVAGTVAVQSRMRSILVAGVTQVQVTTAPAAPSAPPTPSAQPSPASPPGMAPTSPTNPTVAPQPSPDAPHLDIGFHKGAAHVVSNGAAKTDLMIQIRNLSSYPLEFTHQTEFSATVIAANGVSGALCSATEVANIESKMSLPDTTQPNPPSIQWASADPARIDGERATIKRQLAAGNTLHRNNGEVVWFSLEKILSTAPAGLTPVDVEITGIKVLRPDAEGGPYNLGRITTRLMVTKSPLYYGPMSGGNMTPLTSGEMGLDTLRLVDGDRGFRLSMDTSTNAMQVKAMTAASHEGTSVMQLGKNGELATGSVRAASMSVVDGQKSTKISPQNISVTDPQGAALLSHDQLSVPTVKATTRLDTPYTVTKRLGPVLKTDALADTGDLVVDGPTRMLGHTRVDDLSGSAQLDHLKFGTGSRVQTIKFGKFESFDRQRSMSNRSYNNKSYDYIKQSKLFGSDLEFVSAGNKKNGDGTYWIPLNDPDRKPDTIIATKTRPWKDSELDDSDEDPIFCFSLTRHEKDVDGDYILPRWIADMYNQSANIANNWVCVRSSSDKPMYFHIMLVWFG